MTFRQHLMQKGAMFSVVKTHDIWRGDQILSMICDGGRRARLPYPLDASDPKRLLDLEVQIEDSKGELCVQDGPYGPMTRLGLVRADR